MYHLNRSRHGHTEFSAVRWNDAEKGDKLYADMVPLQACDIADAVAYAAQVPKHVNVETMVVMPTAQASNDTSSP